MPASGTRPARFGLAGKIFLASALLVVAVLGGAVGVTSIQANRTADASIRRALGNTRRGVEDFLAARSGALGAMSAVSADVPQFRERLLSSRDHDDVLDQTEVYRDLIGAAWVLVTDAEGRLLARTDYPDEAGQDLSRGALIAGALSGQQVQGAFVDDRDTAVVRLYLAVATPLAAPGAAPQGALVAAYALDDSLAQAIRQTTSSEVVFFALTRDTQPVIVGSTLAGEEIAAALRADTGALQALLADSGSAEIAAMLGGEHLIGLAGPIRSAAGDVFGGVVAFRAREAVLAAFRGLRRTLVAALVLGVALALVSAFVLARQIAGPVRRLAAATRAVQDGDYSVAIDARARDEIGTLARAFKSLVADLREKAALVDYMMSASGAAATQAVAGMPRPSIDSGGDILRPGTLFAGRYEVKEILGAGGMGVVYRAFDRELQEPVAIKTLRPEAMAGDAVALERFKQEIRLARKIAHRNVVRTHDLGEVSGTYYLTMEFVEGTPLKQLIGARGRLPLPVTLTIGKQLCRALEVAHEQGVIHRDIKPQNIVVDPTGFLKVMDFGIARLTDPPKGKGLTEAGMSIGTPDYMSPEQLAGGELDARSDLYSVGVVLFECLTGRVPFEAETTWALVAKHLEEEPPDPRRFSPDVPEPLALVILKTMAKEPGDRFQSAGEVHDALARIG